MIRYVTSVIINLQKCGLLHGSTRRRIEEVCAKDARRSCWYAIRILNGQRFPAGEMEIALDARESLHYYNSVLDPRGEGWGTIARREQVAKWRSEVLGIDPRVL